MAHALAPYLSLSDLNAAAVAYLALITYLLIFTAVALPVLGGPEYAFAEKTVSFGLKCAVINGFRLLYLAV